MPSNSEIQRACAILEKIAFTHGVRAITFGQDSDGTWVNIETEKKNQAYFGDFINLYTGIQRIIAEK